MNNTRAAECKARGDTLAGQGETELAIQAYHQALDLRNDYFEVHANLGNVLLDADRVDDAVATIARQSACARILPNCMTISAMRCVSAVILMRHWRLTTGRCS